MPKPMGTRRPDLSLQVVTLALTQVLASTAPVYGDAPIRPTAVTAESLAIQKYRDGKAAAEAGRNSEALALLQQSLDVIPSPNTRNLIATVLGKMERYASAYRQFLQASSEAQQRVRAGQKKFQSAQDLAEQGIAQLEPFVAKIRLQVPADIPPDFYITIDEEKVPSGLWLQPIPLDPGKHTVTGGTQQGRCFQMSVTLAVQERQELRLTCRGLASSGPPASMRQSAPPRWMFYGAAATAGAALLTGIILGAAAQRSSDAQQSLPLAVTQQDYLTRMDMRSQIQAEAKATNVLLTVGITMGVVSTILAATIPWRRPNPEKYKAPDQTRP